MVREALRRNGEETRKGEAEKTRNAGRLSEFPPRLGAFVLDTGVRYVVQGGSTLVAKASDEKQFTCRLTRLMKQSRRKLPLTK